MKDEGDHVEVRISMARLMDLGDGMLTDCVKVVRGGHALPSDEMRSVLWSLRGFEYVVVLDASLREVKGPPEGTSSSPGT